MKKLIEIKLKYLAKLILARYKPKVVGITGSVGKTSAKEAIFTVLKKKHNVRRNIKNYNNEIGLPLTIIGTDSPGKSLFGWIVVLFKALKLILIKDKEYPEILILEMGVDRPGDMQYLNSIVKPKVGVITLIGPVHLEFFGSTKKIQKEKSELIANLDKDGWAVLNYDNEMTREITKESKAKVLTYGFDEKALVNARELIFSHNQKEKSGDQGNLTGISFKLGYKGSYIPVHLPKVVGKTAVYAALSGAAVGIAFGHNLLEISESLSTFDPPKGRMNLISGIKRTLIIDDTYNSSPQSVIAALEVLRMISRAQGSRRIAVLGDMLELGSYSEEGHRVAGKYVSKTKIDKLIVVGERSRDIARGAEEAGMKRDNIFHFPDTEIAGRFVQDRLKEGDIVLVKGSQGMRMENIVIEIMAEPMRAKELLVRQDWVN